MTEREQEEAPAQLITEEQLRARIAGYEAQLEEVAEMVARVRHEINNPLTSVLGQAQLLLREDLSDRARKRVETIEAMAVRLRDVAAELRQVQKPSAASEKELAEGRS
jgi:two-component system NtrC family sensor kinase